MTHLPKTSRQLNVVAHQKLTIVSKRLVRVMVCEVEILYFSFVLEAQANRTKVSRVGVA